MRPRLPTALILGVLTAPVPFAQADPAVDRTHAFETAYAASFYQFDACGDGLAGRTYRAALTDKFAHCPFTDDERKRFQQRSAAQRRKSSQAIAAMIERIGGLPVKLDGMDRTCREQMQSSEYRAVRTRLDAYAAGTLDSPAIVPQSCDAAEISP